MIDPSTGLYVSPQNTGIDVVIVTDANNSTSQLSISILEPIELFCDVVKEYMGLADDQVYLYNQKFTIPKDERLYINVGFLTDKPFGNNTKFDASGPGLVNVQSVNFAATLNIDFFSRGPDARTRIGEFILALNSDYSQQQQALNGFRIFPLSLQLHNVGWLDGSAIPYRFVINVVIHYFVRKVLSVEYFNTIQDVEIFTDP